MGGQIRLIVADLDGTLLNTQHALQPFTAAAVDAAIEQNVLFTVATGKTFPSTKAVIRRFNIDIPVICGNGTQVFLPDGSLLFEDPIPLEYAVEAVQMALDHGFTPIIYTRDGLLADRYDANVAELVSYHEPEPTIVPDLIQAFRNGHKPYKMVLMNQNHDIVGDFQDQITQTLEGRADVTRSGLASLVEVLPYAVTKGTALQVILDHLGVAMEDTITFGDNCNDLDMIQRAGIGVAMGQAPQAVQDGADHVTSTNDNDGVGHAIYKFVLAPRGVAVRCLPQ